MANEPNEDALETAYDEALSSEDAAQDESWCASWRRTPP